MKSSFCLVQHSITAINGDSEGMPVGILEACAASIPVIATRHAGIISAIDEGKTGFLVDPGDSMALATTLEHAFSPAIDLEEMGLCGRSWYDKNREEESFNLFKMYRET